MVESQPLLKQTADFCHEQLFGNQNLDICPFEKMIASQNRWKQLIEQNSVCIILKDKIWPFFGFHIEAKKVDPKQPTLFDMVKPQHKAESKEKSKPKSKKVFVLESSDESDNEYVAEESQSSVAFSSQSSKGSHHETKISLPLGTFLCDKTLEVNVH